MNIHEPILLVFMFLTMIFGLAGLVVPIFPGLVVIWLAALGYGILTGFTTAGWILFAIITLLMIAGSLIDNFIMGKQAYTHGAAWYSIILAMVIGILGNFIMPVIGGLVGALLALFLIEWLRSKDWREAMTVTRSWAVGWSWAIAVRVLVGLLMVGLSVIWILV